MLHLLNKSIVLPCYFFMRVMILQEKPPSSGTLSPPEKVRPEILHYHYCNLDLDYLFITLLQLQQFRFLYFLIKRGRKCLTPICIIPNSFAKCKLSHGSIYLFQKSCQDCNKRHGCEHLKSNISGRRRGTTWFGIVCGGSRHLRLIPALKNRLHLRCSSFWRFNFVTTLRSSRRVMTIKELIERSDCGFTILAPANDLFPELVIHRYFEFG
jgi:hypothetical protein